MPALAPSDDRPPRWPIGLLGAGAGLALGVPIAHTPLGAGIVGLGLAAVIYALYALLRAPLSRTPGGGLEDGGMADTNPTIGIDVLADPALLVGPDWRLIEMNEGGRGLFGNRAPGLDLRQVVRHPQALDTVRQVLAGERQAVVEVQALGAGDGVFRVRSVAAGEGRWLMTFTDITQARIAERMRADFVANASHELRTPLANISGFIETLLGPAQEDEPARRRFLEIMSREAGRMSRLIDDLLSLSRIELDKHVRPQASLDLAPLIADVARTLAVRLESDGRRLVLEIDEPLPLVTADRDQILQVLHNLLSNALKYGRTATPITLRAARGGDVVRVTVADVGDGVAPEHIPRLTERFYRVDAGRSRSMGGTGLGLAIVKHIVERHRGRLEIASRQGEGTEVSFTLPRHPEPATQAEPSALSSN